MINGINPGGRAPVPFAALHVLQKGETLIFPHPAGAPGIQGVFQQPVAGSIDYIKQVITAIQRGAIVIQRQFPGLVDAGDLKQKLQGSVFLIWMQLQHQHPLPTGFRHEHPPVGIYGDPCRAAHVIVGLDPAIHAAVEDALPGRIGDQLDIGSLHERRFLTVDGAVIRCALFRRAEQGSVEGLPGDRSGEALDPVRRADGDAAEGRAGAEGSGGDDLAFAGIFITAGSKSFFRFQFPVTAGFPEGQLRTVFICHPGLIAGEIDLRSGCRGGELRCRQTARRLALQVIDQQLNLRPVG